MRLWGETNDSNLLSLSPIPTPAPPPIPTSKPLQAAWFVGYKEIAWQPKFAGKRGRRITQTDSLSTAPVDQLLSHVVKPGFQNLI
jgi:hypothetical protein